MPDLTTYERSTDRHAEYLAARACLAASDWVAQVTAAPVPVQDMLSAVPAARAAVKITRLTGCGSPQPELPEWFSAVVSRLLPLLSLPPNWNSEGAEAVRGDAILPMVFYVLNQVMKQSTPAPMIVPTAQGGVQLEWHEQSIDVEIEVEPSGEIHVSVEDPQAGEWEEPFAESVARLTQTIEALSPP